MTGCAFGRNKCPRSAQLWRDNRSTMTIKNDGHKVQMKSDSHRCETQYKEKEGVSHRNKKKNKDFVDGEGRVRGGWRRVKHTKN